MNNSLIFQSILEGNGNNFLSEPTILIQKLGISILIGLLIGLEREYARGKDFKHFAGARTFPLIAVFGFLSALVASISAIWIYALFFLSFVILIGISYYSSASEGHIGMTTEIASILVFLLSSLIFWDLILFSVIIAVVMAAFLSLKFQIRSFVERITEEDIYAVLKLLIVTIIVLPLLPDKSFGPHNALNFKLIWLMVIFIAGISFIGYLLAKIVGYQRGIKLTGLFGGIVSSTALTFTYSKKSKENPDFVKNLAAGIILASTVVYPKVLFEIAAINSSLAVKMILPLSLLTLTGIVNSVIIWRKTSKVLLEDTVVKNPFELKAALYFGLVFGGILFVTKLSSVYLGDNGIFIVSFLSGLPNIDAIVLSLAQLADQQIESLTASKGIIIALISNTLFKFSLTVIIGSRELKNSVLMGFGSFLIMSLIILASFYMF